MSVLEIVVFIAPLDMTLQYQARHWLLSSTWHLLDSKATLLDENLWNHPVFSHHLI